MKRVMEIKEGKRIVFVGEDGSEDIVLAELLEVKTQDQADLMPMQSVCGTEGKYTDVDWIGYAMRFHYEPDLPGFRVYRLLSSYVMNPSTGLLWSATFSPSKIEDGDLILLNLEAGLHPETGVILHVSTTFFLLDGQLEQATYIIDTREVKT